MITIGQLLESVDLDFEPRFVTKDNEGCVIIWGGEPDRACDRWLGAEEFVMYPFLELAEFDGKYWAECIYEVPRKTAGKIEKLEQDPYAKQRRWVGKLCRAFDDDETTATVFGILEKIHGPTNPYLVNGAFYEHCEPIKPTDSIIYKGGYNE